MSFCILSLCQLSENYMLFEFQLVLTLIEKMIKYVDYLLLNSFAPSEKICRVLSHHFSLIGKFLWYMISDDREKKSEVGMRKSERWPHRTETRGQMTEDRGRKGECGSRKRKEAGRGNVECGSRNAEVGKMAP